MSGDLHFDSGNATDVISGDVGKEAGHRLHEALGALKNRSGAGNDFLGWMDLPDRMTGDLKAIEQAAGRIRGDSDVLVVVGIGGSYLGARAVIEACSPFFGRSGPEVLFAGHNIDGEYLRQLLAYLEGKRVSINIISKSGTTTEPALAFRVLRQWMQWRYGREESAKRIYATTDATRGALRKLAEEEGYSSFVIPDDVGGRFSVLTPVGLLPIAAAGISVRELLGGASAMHQRAFSDDPDDNPALMYATLRNALYSNGRTIEVLATFESRLQYVSEWWKQLFGESEGKGGRGIFPASVVNTTDLHSMGQYMQDGMRNLFETFLVLANEDIGEVDADTLTVPEDGSDLDGLNYLAGRSFASINDVAYRATAMAHDSGDVPNATIVLPDPSPHSIGQLFYFFEVAVALGGYALGVNPFDQPGVEDYKRNMFALLGKPGFRRKS